MVNDGVLVAEEGRRLLCAEGLIGDDAGGACRLRELAGLLHAKALGELQVGLSAVFHHPDICYCARNQEVAFLSIVSINREAEVSNPLRHKGQTGYALTLDAEAIGRIPNELITAVAAAVSRRWQRVEEGRGVDHHSTATNNKKSMMVVWRQSRPEREHGLVFRLLTSCCI